MKDARHGYLSKLVAVSKLRGTVNTMAVARYLDIGYETARSALRRLEAAGYVVGERKKGNRPHEEVFYKLTEKGREAVAEGAEIVGIRTDDYKARPKVVQPLDKPDVLRWQELHAALGMGRPVMPERARRGACGLDVEPKGPWQGLEA